MLAPRGFCCCWNAPQRRLVARTATRLVLEQYQPLRSVNTSRAGGGVEPEMRVATLAPAVARAVLLLPSPPPRRLRDCVLPSRQRSCRYARELCAAAHTLVSCSWPAPPFGSPRWWVTCFQLQWRDSLVHLAGGLANVFVTTRQRVSSHGAPACTRGFLEDQRCPTPPVARAVRAEHAATSAGGVAQLRFRREC